MENRKNRAVTGSNESMFFWGFTISRAVSSGGSGGGAAAFISANFRSRDSSSDFFPFSRSSISGLARFRSFRSPCRTPAKTACSE